MKQDTLVKKGSDELSAIKKRESINKMMRSYFPSGPSELKKPFVDKKFSSLSVFERIIEAVKYNFLSFEYALSPKGGLRYWIKLNISLLLLFAIPILLFVPLLTYLFSNISSLSELFSNITYFLYLSALNILKLLLVIFAITLIITFFRMFIEVIRRMLVAMKKKLKNF